MGTVYLSLLNATKHKHTHDSISNGLRHPKGANPERHAAPRTIILLYCYRQPITNCYITHFLPSGPDVRHAAQRTITSYSVIRYVEYGGRFDQTETDTPRCSENYHESNMAYAISAFCYRLPITNYAVVLHKLHKLKCCADVQRHANHAPHATLLTELSRNGFVIGNL